MKLRSGHMLAAAVLLAGISSASAQADRDCYGDWDLGRPESIGLAAVTSKSRLNFIKSSSEQKTCPADTTACRQRAYLVNGDTVVTLGVRGSLTCAVFIGPKGRAAAGWLPTNALASRPLPSGVRQEDWLGEWSGGPEQTITFMAGKTPGSLAAKGDATFGGLDPARVKRGAVNIGEFDGEAAPRGVSLQLTVDDDGKSKPEWSDHDSMQCSVRMLHLGQIILVQDNFNCGGLNVTFTGGYHRQK